MKIAISSMGNQMDSLVDPRLGRAAWFMIVDSETMEFNAIPNEAAEASQGAGIQAAQTMCKLGISAVITGSVGPNAFQALTAAGIRMFEAVDVSVKTAVDQFMNDDVQPILVSAPSGSSPSNPLTNQAAASTASPQLPDQAQAPGQGAGRGRGQGMGRGQGQGMGRGKGQGGGRGGGRRGNGGGGA
ncbi:MAG: NifB/NifX family molybdenum-iron cluster-binding protein [Armatimonadota bacterium]